jgi:nucleotide-binding universal stress UspA family protein
MLSLWLILIAVWLVSGATAVWYLARRGHRHPGWWVVGLLLGPFLWPAAVERVETEAQVVSSDPAFARTGLHVLAGVDGSETSRQAIVESADLLGSRLGALTLVAVVDYEAGTQDDRGTVAEAENQIADLKHLLRERGVRASLGSEIVAGQPTQALLETADSLDVDLIVIGRKGSGASVRLLGSVASRLAENSTRTVLIGTGPSGNPGSDADAGTEG